MPTALVVDDSKMDQHLAGRLLAACADLTVAYADDGEQALELIRHNAPALVLTDLQMPNVDGLALVDAVRAEHPHIPVILMTAHGSETLAAEALRKGAAGYVRKKFLAHDLRGQVTRTLALIEQSRHQRKALDCLTVNTSQFVMDNDTSRIMPMLHYLRDDLARMEICDETALMRVGVALEESLRNAIEHGNLGLDSTIAEQSRDDYYALAAQRREADPYRGRHVHLEARLTPERAVYIIRDEGEGFAVDQLPDPTDPANIEKSTGRGLTLIRAFMDEVHHNDQGNEITMVKLAGR